ncbi:hypothetical protein HU200_036065 [Digitaria exilis]|uniref:Uncharacterized protein n=1 Tax=Digitaria exilis TaxID=1010633 RepID=A0A835EKR6_9POAL|nr:hypothetical protein HU200_036065 [Digitaria exilis]
MRSRTIATASSTASATAFGLARRSAQPSTPSRASGTRRSAAEDDSPPPDTPRS